jgi:hypothetical protein
MFPADPIQTFIQQRCQGCESDKDQHKSDYPEIKMRVNIGKKKYPEKTLVINAYGYPCRCSRIQDTDIAGRKNSRVPFRMQIVITDNIISLKRNK